MGENLTLYVKFIYKSSYIFIIITRIIYHKPLFLSACGPMSLKCIKPQLNKPYSTNSIENDKEFYKWFSGFTDALPQRGMGNFMIFILPKGFTFKFSIGLHIDDLHVLNYIKDKLGFGIVYAYQNTCYCNKKRRYIKNNSYFWYLHT